MSRPEPNSARRRKASTLPLRETWPSRWYGESSWTPTPPGEIYNLARVKPPLTTGTPKKKLTWLEPYSQTTPFLVCTGKAATKAARKRIERLIGTPLDASYGAMLEQCGCISLISENIFGVSNDKYQSCESQTKNARSSFDEWQAHWLAVGDDGRGGYYFLDANRVFHFDHETRSRRFVAQSFAAWIKRIAR